METQRAPRTVAEVVRLPGPAGHLWLVRAEGALDDPGDPAIEALARPAPGCTAAALDLSRVRSVSADAATALAVSAHRRPTYAAGAGGTVNGVLAAASGDGPLVVCRSLDEVIAERTAGPAVPGPPAVAPVPVPGVEELRAEVRDLRGRLRSHPPIAQALGVLQERYRLPAGDDAFRLLRESSQRHNVKLRTVAVAVLSTEPPLAAAELWFPDRVRLPPPVLPFLPEERPDRISQTAVAHAVLDRALAVTGAAVGTVHLVEPPGGGLRLAAHRGEGVLDELDRLPEAESGIAVPAAYSGVLTTVTDVATDPAYTPEARAALLAGGFRSCHSAPLAGPGLRPRGAASVHFDRPAAPLTAEQAQVLDALGAAAGRWLEWHWHTVVLDALEDLHRLARR